MTFQEYISRQGLTIEKLASMTPAYRAEQSREAYSLYVQGRPLWPFQRIDFDAGWQLATEVMAYMHMAQQARKLAEKES